MVGKTKMTTKQKPFSRRFGIVAAFAVAALCAALQAAALREHPASCPPLHTEGTGRSVRNVP